MRERRSHAERSAETRRRILEAAVDSIAEVGFARTTAAEVTRRADVTWGAVQHHFGGKRGLLMAVLEDSFRRFAERLADLPDSGEPLEKRAGDFLDRAWEHFGSRFYRSTYEILLNDLGREDAAADGEGLEGGWQERMFRGWDAVWMRILGDAPIPRRRHFVLQRYTISVLSGLASTLMLEGPEARLRPAELDLLKESLVRELTRAS